MAHTATFDFPIRDLGGVTQMHIISPSTLPKFHGLENKYQDIIYFGLK